MTELAIREMSVRMDELIVANNKLQVLINKLVDQNMESRITALMNQIRDVSIKVDTLSSDGISLVPAPPVVVSAGVETKVVKKSIATPVVADKPMLITGNKLNWYKRMCAKFPEELHDRGLIGTEDFKALQAAIESKDETIQKNVIQSAYNKLTPELMSKAQAYKAALRVESEIQNSVEVKRQEVTT